jgi:nitronate monooxygenase
LRTELQSARDALTVADRIASGAKLPIGVALFGWKLDASPDVGEEMLDTVLQADVQAIWLSFGEKLGRWVERFRAKDSARNGDNADSKTILFVLVNTMEEAKQAIEDWKADVIVAQGSFPSSPV